MNVEVKWRKWFKGIPPRPIKLEIPGWAGDFNKQDNGVVPQPWHCVPFVEGSTYGLELLYPFDTECHVIKKDGNVSFSGNFKNEFNDLGFALPPFSNFAPGHYGFTSSLDMQVPDDFVIRLEPHPNFFTDMTGNVPCAVPGHIQSWWSRIFFVVFKAPSEGQTHIFRKNEPYAKVMIVPKKMVYDIKEMTETEKLARIKREEDINTLGGFIANKSWRDNFGNQFDDKYKVLNSIYSKFGEEGINFTINKAREERDRKTNIKIPYRMFKDDSLQIKQKINLKETSIHCWDERDTPEAKDPVQIFPQSGETKGDD